VTEGPDQVSGSGSSAVRFTDRGSEVGSSARMTRSSASGVRLPLRADDGRSATGVRRRALRSADRHSRTPRPRR
jgi:hypothetical protein